MARKLLPGSPKIQFSKLKLPNVFHKRRNRQSVSEGIEIAGPDGEGVQDWVIYVGEERLPDVKRPDDGVQEKTLPDLPPQLPQEDDAHEDTSNPIKPQLDLGGGSTGDMVIRRAAPKITSTGQFHLPLFGESASRKGRRVPANRMRMSSGRPDPVAALVDPYDLLHQMQGLHRLLDLYTESSSSGLVDKVIIAQESLASFVNTIKAGAYQSVTHIDFEDLDQVTINPIGICGSKSEIAKLLLQAGTIDEKLMALLLRPHEAGTRDTASLRSGIYALFAPTIASPGTTPSATEKHTVFIIYWPEETTWDDSAVGSVQKNRVTFMRYLTCLADQVRVLISTEHAASIVWDGMAANSYQDIDSRLGQADDHTEGSGRNRFFRFEVAVSSELEDTASLGASNMVSHPEIGRVDISQAPQDQPEWANTFSPPLLLGETAQGFTSSKYLAGYLQARTLKGAFNPISLSSELKKHPKIQFSQYIEPDALDFLLEEGGLASRDRPRVEQYKKDMASARNLCKDDCDAKLNLHIQEIDTDKPRLRVLMYLFVARHMCDIFRNFTEADLIQAVFDSNKVDLSARINSLAHLRQIWSVYPQTEEMCDTMSRQALDEFFKSPDYQALLSQMIRVHEVINSPDPELTQSEKLRAIRDIMATTDGRWGPKALLSKVKNPFSRFPGRRQSSQIDPPQSGSNMSTVQPISNGGQQGARVLEDLVRAGSSYEDVANEISRRTLHMLSSRVSRIGAEVAQALDTTQRDQAKVAARISRTRAYEDADRRTASDFERDILRDGTRDGAVLRINSVKIIKPGKRPECALEGTFDEWIEPCVQHFIRRLEPTSEDLQRMKEDSQFIPVLRVSNSIHSAFEVPVDWVIRRLQLLPQRQVLLVADTPNGVVIWFFSIQHRSKIPPKPRLPAVEGRRIAAVAVDEQKRKLAIVFQLPDRCSVQLFQIDDTYTQAQSRGTPHDLAAGYPDAHPDIVTATFFVGTDDLCLIEGTGRIRVYSFLSQRFKSGIVSLSTRPLHVQSTPDGGAVLVIERLESGTILRTFHQASFGHNNEGLSNAMPLPFDSATQFSVTSVGGRGKAFVTALSRLSGCLHVISVDVGKRDMQYKFQASHERDSSTGPKFSKHNCLMNCFAEVWSRFPVVAAIQRETISSMDRLSPSIIFVCDVADRPFQDYFRQMIRRFERKIRKPTEQRLDKILVLGALFEDLDWGIPSSSSFKSGQWLVELLCLIPIHIAIARENHFVPLTDGVLNAESEHRLLGADVSTIIDSISLGWYESIFKSYMSSKPVKVISSMGEQSVGKSYSLNHMIDSSFAGSAVRTTEGVWLSVCPTEDCLVVALDFEGVHSVERTPQEDMLLVLFNAALSNLVIFRNNFALSRDVANMFTSFQASTRLFDPALNPTLFKGLLAIVIKDVVDNDRDEIVKEFSSKFHQIVSSEQAQNFITVLHDSQLVVIPWSVIESQEFYVLFSHLAELLQHQKSTHGTAAEFLVTLKSLMAKMKAQDWGSIDQTVIKHRITALLAELPTAFAYGKVEDGAGDELYNLDDQAWIPHDDTAEVFCVEADDAKIQDALSASIRKWKRDAAREPLIDLQTHLVDIGSRRIEHVRDWLADNIARFPKDSGDIRQLERAYDDMAAVLQTNLRVCSVECSSCCLPCMLPKAHDQKVHDCQTTHACLSNCEFSNEPGHAKVNAACAMRAGHEGRHMCNGVAHLCGGSCHLANKKGCQQQCALPIDHQEPDHLCSARNHQCGEPCDARGMIVTGLEDYSCDGVCSHSYVSKSVWSSRLLHSDLSDWRARRRYPLLGAGGGGLGA